MEFAFRSRQAAPDDVEAGRLRRFSDLPPPPYGDSNANASPVDAALSRRREELLWELTKVRNRQDMILRELFETEHAMGMGFTAAGYNPVPTLPSSQDYWRSRTPPVNPLETEHAMGMGFTAAGYNPVPTLPSSQDYWRSRTPPVNPLEEAPPPPSVSWGPAAMRVPPVYPHVEWAPSPLPQQLRPRDTEMQQACRSSGARMDPFDGCVELCRSPKKSAVAEEASVPAATNDGARPTFRDAGGGEHKDGVKDARGAHSLYENENQSSGQRKTAEITLMDQINGPMMSSGRYRMGGQESVPFRQQNGQEFSKPTPEQPRLGDDPEQQQEFRSSGLGSHVFRGYVERRLSPSKQAPPVRDQTLVPVAAKVGELASAFCGEPKAEVEDGHHVQPFGEIRNRSIGEKKAVESATEDRTDEPTRLPGQHRPAGLENATYNELKFVHESTSAGVKRKVNVAASPSKKQKPLGENSCTICNVNTPSPRNLAEHLGGKMHKWNVTAMLRATRNGTTQPNPETTPVRKTTTATNTKSYQNVKENVAAGSSGSKHGGKPHVKSFAHRKDAADTGKKADWKSKFYCKLCDAQCNTETMLASHLGGKRHREKLLEGGSV